MNMRELIEQATPEERRTFFADVPRIIQKYVNKQATEQRKEELGINYENQQRETEKSDRKTI